MHHEFGFSTLGRVGEGERTEVDRITNDTEEKMKETERVELPRAVRIEIDEASHCVFVLCFVFMS